MSPTISQPFVTDNPQPATSSLNLPLRLRLLSLDETTTDRRHDSSPSHDVSERYYIGLNSGMALALPFLPKFPNQRFLSTDSVTPFSNILKCNSDNGIGVLGFLLGNFVSVCR